MRRPVIFGLGFSMVKTGFADWLVQTQIEKREKIDWSRNMTFSLFGLVYLGGWQYYLYCKIFPKLFPGASRFATMSIRQKLQDKTGQMNAIGQILMDQFVHHPWMYFPCFYMLKQMMNGNDAHSGLMMYKENIMEDLMALWKIWIPAMTFNFIFCPMWMRIPLVATTSLGWTMIISYMRGSNDKAPAEDLETEQEFDFLTYRWPKKRLDSQHSHLVVTFTGKDQIGLLSRITNTVEARGGAIQESKVMSFGDSFAIMFLISTARRDKSLLEHSLEEISLECNINTNILEANNTEGIWNCSDEQAVFRVQLTGPEQPGIVAGVTTLVSELGFNIEKMKSGAIDETSPDGDSMCAHFEVNLIVSHRDRKHDSSLLEKRLEILSNEKGLRFEFQPVEVRMSHTKPRSKNSPSFDESSASGENAAAHTT